jgi:hypothetical protein
MAIPKGESMLKNGNFEKDWEEEQSHKCWIFPVDVPAYQTDIGNIFTPPNWMTWFKHDPDVWDQPEVRDAWKSGDPRRVYEGEKAMLLFTFWRNHDAGFMQQVAATPGQYLCLEAHAHAWSNWNDGPHPDDPKWSEGAHVGYEKVKFLDSQPGLDDGDRNFTFQLGIDPTGGVNPFANTVVWGQGAHIYNEHAPVPAVSAVAECTTVTVFLRSRTLWTYKHNDAYWDGASLTVVDSPPVPYKCVTLVLPQDATPGQLAEILQLAYPDRRTFCFSNDDSGRLGGTTILYNISRQDKQRYINWYAQNYPQTRVEFDYTSDWDIEGILLGQCDEPWRNQRYGNGGGPTYCAKGCWITDCAMALRFLGLDPDATPLTVDAAVGHSGYNANYAMLHSAMPRMGLQMSKYTTNAQVAQEHLDAGHVCFAEVKPSSLLHFVMVTKHENGRYWAYDPWQRTVGWLDKSYAGVESWRLILEADTPPPPPPPPVPVFISFQQQRAADYRDEFISRVQPPAWLLIGGFEEARHLKSLAPNMEIAIRHVDNAWGQYIHANDKDAAAERWLRHHGQTLFDQADCIDWMFDLNEYIATNDYETLRATPSWIEALVKRLEYEGWPARIVGLNVPIGNPQHNYICDEQSIPRQIPLLTPAVRILTDNDCLTAYHSYWGIRKLGGGQYYSTLDEPASVRMHYAFRALLSWDPVFTAAGVYPKYALSEGGPIYINEAGVMVSSGAGWKYSKTFDGNVDACVASYLQFQMLVQKWNAEHSNRARWLTAFLHGGFTEWRHFDMAGNPSRRLADALV